LISFHLVFVLIFGISFLDEKLTMNKMFGILFILISIILFYNDN